MFVIYIWKLKFVTKHKYQLKMDPNKVDANCLSVVVEARNFPVILGSIDCIYWEWKNYPSS